MIGFIEASKPLHRWFNAAVVVDAAQKLRLGGVQYRSKLMSIFGKIGSFFRISALGAVEAVSALFQRTQPESASDRTSISFPNYAGNRSERTSSSEPCESRTFAADRLRWMANNPPERLPSSEPCDLEFATRTFSTLDVANTPAEHVMASDISDPELATAKIFPISAANSPPGLTLSSEPCDLELVTVNVSNVNAENNSRGRVPIKRTPRCRTFRAGHLYQRWCEYVRGTISGNQIHPAIPHTES